MNQNLSEQQELLLFKACKERNGVLPVSMAYSMYSSKSSAKSALEKLRLFGFVELKTPGYFEVVALPNNVKRELKDLQETAKAEA